MRRGLTEQLNNCFMCNNPYDQKPLIEEDEKSGSPLSDFKRGFSLFCKILKDVHNCGGHLLTKFAESYENAEIEKEVDLVMGARGKSGVFESPCCSLCYDTLVTILGLQKAIEKSQAKQLDHVKNLKEVLELSSDSAHGIGYNYEDFWTTIRRQLVACLTPSTSLSDGDGYNDDDDTNEFSYLEDEDSDNDEFLIPTPTSSIYASTSKDPLDTNFERGQKVVKSLSVISKSVDGGQASLKRKQRYDNIRQEDEPISSKPKVGKSAVKSVVTPAIKSVMKPCLVHLEKLNFTKITRTDEVRVNQSSYCEVDEGSSGVRFRKPRCTVFYLLGQNLVMFHYTCAKFTSDGFYCQENNCKEIIKGTDYNSFQQLRYHILDDHENSQYSVQSRQCPLCPEKCSNGPEFRDHLLRSHKRELKFVCEACWKPFPEKGTFVHNTTQVEKHMWTHKNANEVLEASEEMKLRKMKGGKEYNLLLRKIRQRAKQEGKQNSQSSQIPLLAKEILLNKSEFEDEEDSGVNEDGPSNEPLFGENDDADYCEIEQNLKMKPLSDKIERRSRCNDFYTVGGKHLLFQQTFIRYSPLGFQCLEGGSCFHTVSGTDYYSFQEIRYHILDDHEGSEYPRIPRSCIVCKQKYPNGTLLRRHLLSEHAACMKLICESCRKPFPATAVGSKLSVSLFQSHTSSHKCIKEKAVEKIMETFRKQYGTKEYNKKMQGLRKKVKASGRKLTPRRMLAVKLLKHWDIIMKDEHSDSIKENAAEVYFPGEYDNEFEPSDEPPIVKPQFKNATFTDKAGVRRSHAIEGITKPEEEPSRLKKPKKLSFFKNCQRLAKERTLKATESLSIYNNRPTRTSSLFWLVGEELLLFQNTTVHFSHDEFKCLEKNCWVIVKRGEDSESSLKEIAEHINEDHKSLLNYGSVSRECPICQEGLEDGYSLRIHLFQVHFCPAICIVCWKPLNPNNSSFAAVHMWTHKSAEEKAIVIAEGGNNVDELKAKDASRKRRRAQLKRKLLHYKKSKSRGPLFLPRSAALIKTEVETGDKDADDDKFDLFNEALSAEDDNYCEVEKKKQEITTKTSNKEITPSKPSKVLTNVAPKRARCNEFHTVGKKHLLFQHTFIRYSPLGLQCLEGGNCFHKVEGTNYNSFQDIRYHVMFDHDGTNYSGASRTCIVCKQDHPNGTLLRLHLFSKHRTYMKRICESCRKPFPPVCNKVNTLAEFHRHSCTHKSKKEKIWDKEANILVKKHGVKEYKKKMKCLRKRVMKSGQQFTPKRVLAMRLLKRNEIFEDGDEDVSEEEAAEVVFPEELEDSDFEGITPPVEEPRVEESEEGDGEMSFFENCRRLAKNRRLKAIKNLSHGNSRPNRTSSLFWLVGEELLLFQNTTIHFSHDEFQCLEKNCERIVKRREDSELSFTEIGNHINEDHKSQVDYRSISRKCPICKETLKDGYSLRIHLFQVHFCPAICIICWKPLDPNNTNFAAIHMWTHKSVVERTAVVEAGGKDLDPFPAKGTIRHQLGKKKGKISYESKCEKSKSSTRTRAKAEMVLKTEGSLEVHETSDLIPSELGVRRSKQKAVMGIRNSLKEASGSKGEEDDSDTGNTSSVAFRKKKDDGEFEPNEASMNEEESEDEGESSSEDETNDDESNEKCGKSKGGQEYRKRMFPVRRKFLLGNMESKIYVLKDDLLMYVFSLLKLSHGEIQCLEGDCDKKVGSFEYDAIAQMKTHIKLCHQDRYASRSCKICGEELEDGIQFRRHQLREHSISPSTFLCEICLKPVITGDIKCDSLHVIHKMSHLSDQELQAAVVNRKNKDSFLKKIKAAKLGQEEEYMEGGLKCEVCGKEFSHEYNLKLHTVVHQPASMRKKFECSYCHVKLLSRVALRSHVERQHRPDLQKKFRDCPVCNRRFHYRDGERFRTHMRNHNDEKPFVCEICGKGFSNKGHMKFHIESHNEERDYQCEFCEKNYKYKKHLERHKKTAH